MDRSDQETQFYERIGRGDRLRIGALVGIVLAVAFSVAVTLAASPEPSDGSGSPAVPSASTDPSATTAPATSSAPSATTAPAATTAPGATTAPQASGAPDDKHGLRGWGPGFGGPGGRGSGSVFGPITVSAINGSSVALVTADGWTRTITVGDSVKVTKAGTDASLTDLKVGDEVRLRQAKATDGTYTVTGIDIVLPVVFGEVTAKTSDSITVKLPDGTSTTIHVGSGTTYRVGGVDNATLADVAVNSRIVAQGTKRADGSLDAVSVGSGFGHGLVPGGRGPGGWPFGPKPNDGPQASPGASTAPG